ncbi:MAG: purine-nucleoside phosphorylase [Bacteroidetes bacterium]|nr:purine-nucleoside phosphorylase [Bacteroidota bacterium]
MGNELTKIQTAVNFLKEKIAHTPSIAIILGTGLGKLIDEIKIALTIDYKDIPHFPVSTVESHAGKLIIGTIGEKRVIAMQGRFHFYEGYSMQEVVFPVRVLKLLGVQKLLISNASGCLNPEWKKGTLLLINDHINLQTDNPLRGKNIDELGPRFPDMSCPYNTDLNTLFRKKAQLLNIDLHEGVYVSVPGPNLETRAEYKFLRLIGADAVGMSTVPEVIAANHMNLPCAAISVLTDECNPLSLTATSLEEIIKVANETEPQLARLFVEVIKELA